MVKKYTLLIMIAGTLAVATPCKAGNLYEDVKHFVQTNPHYRHGLALASGIYSYLLLADYFKNNQGNLDPKLQGGLAFAGSFISSKVVHENPGFTTLCALGLMTYSLLK